MGLSLPQGGSGVGGADEWVASMSPSPALCRVFAPCMRISGLFAALSRRERENPQDFHALQSKFAGANSKTSDG